MRTFYNSWVLLKLVVAYIGFLIAPSSSYIGSWSECQILYFAFGDGPHSKEDWLNIGLFVAVLFLLFIVARQ